MPDEKIEASEVLSEILSIGADIFAAQSKDSKITQILLRAGSKAAKSKKVAPRINKGWEHTKAGAKEGWQRLKELSPSTSSFLEEKDPQMESALCCLMCANTAL